MSHQYCISTNNQSLACEDIKGKSEVKTDKNPYGSQYDVNLKITENYDPELKDPMIIALKTALAKTL